MTTHFPHLVDGLVFKKQTNTGIYLANIKSASIIIEIVTILYFSLDKCWTCMYLVTTCSTSLFYIYTIKYSLRGQWEEMWTQGLWLEVTWSDWGKDTFPRVTGLRQGQIPESHRSAVGTDPRESQVWGKDRSPSHRS
jgi:hypothetical protein